MTIRLKKHIDSETLHLPELRHLIGKTVDITVEETPPTSTSAVDPLLRQASDEFWNPPSIEEIARRQGIDLNKPAPVEELFGSLTAKDFEGFDEWLEEIRRGPWRAEPIDDKDE